MSELSSDAVTRTPIVEGPVGQVRFGVAEPLGFADVQLRDGLLGQWQERNAERSLHYIIEQLETSGVLHNFRRIADGEDGPYVGMPFADTDLYKTLEAIGWESGRRGTVVEGEFLDSALSLIERTQAEDGYLNTFVQGGAGAGRWENLIWSHELYTAGHLFQAAVALSRGLGDDRLLEISLRFARRILDDLGGRDDAFDGHAEVETALAELYRLTGDERLLDFAGVQLRRRGYRTLPKDVHPPEYFGDHLPLDEVREAVGHAVRQLYYGAGLTDFYLETGESRYFEAAQRVWSSAQDTKTYLTGGHGSRHMGEEFGDAYELPADRAYTETCAGIASFQWSWRMLLATGESRYADAMERVLLNTIGAAVSADGTHFFYTNPLQIRTGHIGASEANPSERLTWFDCACCPPNLARFLASIHNYLFTRTGEGLQIHQYAAAEIRTRIGEVSADVRVETDYPWSGRIAVTVDAAGAFEVALRVPSWAHEWTVSVDGEQTALEREDGYVRITRDWTGGHRIVLDVPMTATVVRPHPWIDAIRGTVAITRGPLVYCLEAADHGHVSALENIYIDQNAPIAEIEAPVPNAEVALTTEARIIAPHGRLYETGEPLPVPSTRAAITAIPYYAWGNRAPGAMRVWIPTAPIAADTADSR